MNDEDIGNEDINPPKFRNIEAYNAWCRSKISSLNYARIAMNNDKIVETLDEIDSMLHLSEGQRLIGEQP